MNKNFPLSFKIADIIALVSSLAVSASLIIGTTIYESAQNSKERYVEIYHDQKELNEYRTDLNSLKGSYIVTLTPDIYPDLLDDFVIEMDRDKGIRVKEVTCPNHTCINQGWVNIDNLPIICIPNNIEVVIKSASSSSTIVV